MPKKQLLSVGQTVWLETTSRHGCDIRYEDEPSKMLVLEANKTSAYIWFAEAESPHKTRYKVNQKTHDVKYSIPDGRSYRLWLSKQEYEQNVIREKEEKELRKKLHNMIDVMPLIQLRSLDESLFN